MRCVVFVFWPLIDSRISIWVCFYRYSLIEDSRIFESNTLDSRKPGSARAPCAEAAARLISSLKMSPKLTYELFADILSHDETPWPTRHSVLTAIHLMNNSTTTTTTTSPPPSKLCVAVREDLNNTIEGVQVAAAHAFLSTTMNHDLNAKLARHYIQSRISLLGSEDEEDVVYTTLQIASALKMKIEPPIFMLCSKHKRIRDTAVTLVRCVRAREFQSYINDVAQIRITSLVSLTHTAGKSTFECKLNYDARTQVPSKGISVKTMCSILRQRVQQEDEDTSFVFKAVSLRVLPDFTNRGDVLLRDIIKYVSLKTTHSLKNIIHVYIFSNAGIHLRIIARSCLWPRRSVISCVSQNVMLRMFRVPQSRHLQRRFTM